MLEITVTVTVRKEGGVVLSEYAKQERPNSYLRSADALAGAIQNVCAEAGAKIRINRRTRRQKGEK